MPDIPWTGEQIDLNANSIKQRITVTAKLNGQTVEIPTYHLTFEPGTVSGNVGTYKVRLVNASGVYGDAAYPSYDPGLEGEKTVTVKVVKKQFAYTIRYDNNEYVMRSEIAKKLNATGKYGSLTENDIRITGTMKNSTTAYGAKLAANAYKVQYKNTQGKWGAVPAKDLKFAGWSVSYDKNVRYKNQGAFKPTFLQRLTYGTEITLYAVWE